MTEPICHVVPRASPPPPSSLWSHAVEAAGWLYVTGQLPTDPDDPQAALADGIEPQAEFCFENIHRILAHTGFGLSDAVFVRIYLRHFERDFASFNAVYARHFEITGTLPARTTIGVAALALGALVEIDLVCFNPKRSSPR